MSCSLNSHNLRKAKKIFYNPLKALESQVHLILMYYNEGHTLMIHKAAQPS